MSWKKARLAFIISSSSNKRRGIFSEFAFVCFHINLHLLSIKFCIDIELAFTRQLLSWWGLLFCTLRLSTNTIIWIWTFLLLKLQLNLLHWLLTFQCDLFDRTFVFVYQLLRLHFGCGEWFKNFYGIKVVSINFLLNTTEFSLNTTNF